MENSRLFPLIPLALLALLTGNTRLSGCGGWWEEEPPRSLAGDLNRLPAKTLGQILLETRETAAESPPAPVTRAEVLELLAMIGTKNPQFIAARLDRFVLQSRATYAANPEFLNTLYDIRDAVTSRGPKDDERRSYAEWRVNHEPAAETALTPPDFAKGDPMRPHKLYLEGAARFTTGDRKECRAWFDEIIKHFNGHPRAETARFLLARCDLWLASYTGEFLEEAEQKKRLSIAENAFRDYLGFYPEGRYAADAHGWLGGILWESHPAESLEHYIMQFDDPAHPECAKSAAHMIEKELARVASNPEGGNDEVFEVLAMYPRIAQAAVYFVLNAPEINPYDRKYDEPAALKQWRIKVLPRLAAAASKEKSLYQGEWSFRLRAMLAQAASADGRQEEALKLTDGPVAELTASDDLLFARLVALQRAGKSREAVDAGLLFLKTFNKSPLRAAVPVRLALAMVDEHRAGEAYLNLCLIDGQDSDRWNGRNDTVYPPGEDNLDITQSSVYPDISGTDAAADLKETILNLAPLDELEAVVGRQEWLQKPELLADFKLMLVRRKASHEDFVGASRFVENPELQENITRFELLAEATGKGGPLEKAQAMVALGDELEAAWLRLGDHETDRFHQGHSNLVLRENARALGFSNPDPELENRNLLRHATRWWSSAALTAPDTDLAAKARVKALEGIRLAALSSEYDFTRAIESETAAASREIYHALLTDSPGTKEARGAMYWSFPPCPRPRAREGEEENFESWRIRWDIRGAGDSSREVSCALRLGGYPALPYTAFGGFGPLRQSDSPENSVIGPMLKELQEVTADTADLSERFSASKVSRNFELARGSAENAAQSRTTNLFEDLTHFYQVPGLTEDARDEYIRLRLRCSGYPEFHTWDNKPDPRPPVEELFNHARENPELTPARDFIDYAELYAGAVNSIPLEDQEKRCREFLEKHPASPRREACSLLLMRTIYRQLPMRFGPTIGPDGFEVGAVIRESDEEFRKESLENAITAYEKEFPRMRYAAEVRNLRGIIAWRAFNYGPALDLTIAQLDDMSHLDLRREAAFRLASIFADLAASHHRKDVVAALQSRPAAISKLKLYLAIVPLYKDHPLRCLGGMLEDELELGSL